MLDARNVAYLLGGKVIGRDKILAPGPQHSRHDKSLSVLLDPKAPDGFVVVSFAGDDWRDCKAYVLQKLGLPPWWPGNGHRHVPSAASAEAGEAAPAWTVDEVARINQARGTWRDGVNPAGTLAETYLRQHRKIELNASLAGTVLRFHPACPWHDENIGQTIKVPALLAAFRQIDNDTITAVQRVRLDADGHKIDRRMLGVVSGAAIKLAIPNDGNLAVAEGVETAMAAMQLGFHPTWALGSCGSIARLPVIDGISQLTLLGEVDAASADAIKTCSTRWLRAGRRVRIAMPDDGCGDLNDELISRAAS
jgi:putative DNA primase/helicase